METGVRMAEAVAVLLVSAAAVATIFTVMSAETGLGAVYIPEELMDPQADPEHPDDVSDQLTVWLELPLTVAVNC